MANEADFYIKQGDTSPELRVELLEDDGSVPPLDTALVRCKTKKIAADSTTVDDRSIVSDPSNGHVRYEWQSGDTDTSGYYNTVFQVDYDGVNVINDESITYTSGTDVYPLNSTDVLVKGHHTVSIEDASGDTYERGTDFAVVDEDGDDELDSIDWNIGGSTPDDSEDFFVDYSYASVFTADETFPNDQYIVVKVDEPL